MSEEIIYSIKIKDRSYYSYEYYNMINNETIILDMNPLEHKLISNDIFLVKDNKI